MTMTGGVFAVLVLSCTFLISIGLCTFDRYDTNTDSWDFYVHHYDEWSPRQEQNHPGVIGQRVEVLAVDTDIYVVGGVRSDKRRQCLKYDTSNEQWTSALTPPSARPGPCSLAYMDGKIVLCGSFHSQIEVYDISRDVWQVSSLEMPLKMVASTMVL